MPRDLEITQQGSITGNLVSDIDALAQKVRIKLKTFLGEWPLDSTVGIPYFEQVLVRNQNSTAVEGLLISQIESTPGVNEVTEFNLTFNKATRRSNISFTATTESEVIDLDFDIGI